MIDAKFKIFEPKTAKITDYFLGNRLMRFFTEEFIQSNGLQSNLTSTDDSKTEITNKKPLTINTNALANAEASIVPYWMAPEVLENEEYDQKVDVYSFGILLIELMTGKSPFGNIKSIEELIQFVSIQVSSLYLSFIALIYNSERTSIDGNKGSADNSELNHALFEERTERAAVFRRDFEGFRSGSH